MKTILIYLILIAVTAFALEVIYNNNCNCSTASIGKKQTLAIKGFAISIVILSHFAGLCGTRLFTPLGGVGVAIFLCLSGYGLNESYIARGIHGYWKKRVLTVYPAYLIVSIIYMLFGHVSLNWKIIIENLLSLNPVVPNMWFIRYMFFWYLIFGFSKMIVNGKYDMLFLSIGAFFSFLFFPEIMAEQSLSFLSGVLISKNKEIIFRRYYKTVIVGGAIVGILALALKQVEIVRYSPFLVINMVQLLIKLPLALFCILVLYIISRKISCFLFIWLGMISYELYLVHGIVLESYFNASVISLFKFLFLSIIFALGLHSLMKYIIAKVM